MNSLLPLRRRLLPLLFLPLPFACGGQTSRQDAADSAARAGALPERSQDAIVDYACRIIDAAARDLTSDNDIPAVCLRAGNAMGTVAAYCDSLSEEERRHFDTPEARQALSEAKRQLQESYDRRIGEIRQATAPQK